MSQPRLSSPENEFMFGLPEMVRIETIGRSLFLNDLAPYRSFWRFSGWCLWVHRLMMQDSQRRRGLCEWYAFALFAGCSRSRFLPRHQGSLHGDCSCSLFVFPVSKGERSGLGLGLGLLVTVMAGEENRSPTAQAACRAFVAKKTTRWHKTREGGA